MDTDVLGSFWAPKTMDCRKVLMKAAIKGSPMNGPDITRYHIKEQKTMWVWMNMIYHILSYFIIDCLKQWPCRGYTPSFSEAPMNNTTSLRLSEIIPARGLRDCKIIMHYTGYIYIYIYIPTHTHSSLLWKLYVLVS